MINKLKNSFLNSYKLASLPILALIWVSFFWGTTWLASKEGVKHMPALQMVGIRQFLGGLLYVGYFIIKKSAWPKGNQWKSVIVLSILNFLLSNALSTWGVKYISSGLGAIIGALFPLWIVLITVFEGKKVSYLSIFGLVISFFGVCFIFFEHLADFLKPEFRFGIILSIISTLSWAFGTLYIRKKAASFNPYFSLGLQMLISSCIILVFTSITETGIALSNIPSNSWWSIVYLVIIGSVLTFIAFIYMIQKLPAEISSIYAYINPIVAIILGFFIFEEPLTITIAIGGIITLIGLYLVNYSFRKEKNKFRI